MGASEDQGTGVSNPNRGRDENLREGGVANKITDGGRSE